jgi:hypothetical protein
MRIFQKQIVWFLVSAIPSYLVWILWGSLLPLPQDVLVFLASIFVSITIFDIGARRLHLMDIGENLTEPERDGAVQ